MVSMESLHWKPRELLAWVKKGRTGRPNDAPLRGERAKRGAGSTVMNMNDETENIETEETISCARFESGAAGESVLRGELEAKGSEGVDDAGGECSWLIMIRIR